MYFKVADNFVYTNKYAISKFTGPQDFLKRSIQNKKLLSSKNLFDIFEPSKAN